METRTLFRRLRILAVVAVILGLGVRAGAAQPPAPIPISPGEGSTIVAPTFSWQAAGGATKYEVEVGAQSDPNAVLWSAQTVALVLTASHADSLPNAPLYWRVRGKDAGNVAGPWSSKINFTKGLPAPTLISPANGSLTVTVPTFEWQVQQGAAYYKVELSTSPTFIVVEATYTTYNTRVTPQSTLAHGIHYWRVTGMDAGGQAGTPSAGWSFTKDIPAPALVSPYDGHPNVHIPTFEWQVVPEAAYYQVEVSATPTFVPIEETYTTYNTRLTPENTLPHGMHYWRVSGVDADGHVGTPGAVRSFTKGTDGPVLISPGIDPTIDLPTMEWAAVEGAAYYKVELSTSDTFVPILATYTTYNLQITPVDALALGLYYWRVSGVDTDGHEGAYHWRRFTLTASAPPTDTIPQLDIPAHGATLTTDPTFRWSRVQGAHDYRLIVSTNPSFSGSAYDTLITDYNIYTPYFALKQYPNDTYYWKVEARAPGGAVMATSEARSFTKEEPLPLAAPANGATRLPVDPTFQWSQIVGAHDYRLIVSTDPGFGGSAYDTLTVDYNSYTPYFALKAYPNGTYYWKVEARRAGGTVISTSEARSFTKEEPLPLVAPADGATGLTVDPSFEWSPIVGAHDYRLIVSTNPAFSGSAYDTLSIEYNRYTPYFALKAYPNGTYYWKVEARRSGGTVISTSEARSFTKQEPLLLIAPANGVSGLPVALTFQWSQIVGAHDYRLIVSTNPSFSGSAYDTVTTDYSSYTPYSPAGRASYGVGTYWWKVEARRSGGTVIATSSGWSFGVQPYRIYLPAIRRRF
jgi:hypothetical protein